MNKILTYICLLLLLFSCKGRQTNYLEQALALAGDNRPELEKVLQRYASNPGDSLKYRAAVFLIENMPEHYSCKYPDYLQSYYDELCNGVSLDYDNITNKHIIEHISAEYNSDTINTTVMDIQTLTAEYIIDNIERAFDVWENGEWATHVSFDDFCEYILPYKSGELQPIDNWREYAKDMLKGDIDLLHYCDLYKNLAFQAATSVSKEIITLNRQDYPPGNINSIPIKDIRTIIKMPYGSCEDHTFLALSIMRSKGIPVMGDFTPQWPFQAAGHSWNILLNNNGKNMIFSAGSSTPREVHKPDEKMAKVFRNCYAINREILSIHSSEKTVPSTFKNYFLKDVTDEYMNTNDVEIKIPATFGNKYKYAYLAVFDNKNWIPVQYGKVTGKKVLFKNMGRNCMYMPVFYSESGVIPFDFPFCISPKGTIRRYEADKAQDTTLHIYRKYFIAKHCYGVGNRTQGGRFEAANCADFKDAVTVHVIPNFTVQSGEVFLDTLQTPYRYWRYYSADNQYNNMAELYFFKEGNEQPVYGKIIGTNGSCSNQKINEKEAVFDGDPLTYYDALTYSHSWIGMDFEHPVKIKKISYTPRGDGNDITPGDIHELLYWCDNQWITTGQRKTADIKLVYGSIPSNTIIGLEIFHEERMSVFSHTKTANRFGGDVGSSVKPCVYPQILATLNRKNFISVIPLSEALNALIFALKDSAEAFVERLMKKFNTSS